MFKKITVLIICLLNLKACISQDFWEPQRQQASRPISTVVLQRNSQNSIPQPALLTAPKQEQPRPISRVVIQPLPSPNISRGNNANLSIVSQPDYDEFRRKIQTDLQLSYIVLSQTNPPRFNLVSVWAQPANPSGLDYFAKVQISESEYVHLRIFKPQSYPSQRMEILAFQKGKKLNDPINPLYFIDNPRTFISTTEMPVPATTRIMIPASPIGQLSQTKPVDDDVTMLAACAWPEYVRQTGSIPYLFTPLCYRSQANKKGELFYVKVQIGVRSFAHLSILRGNPPFPGSPGQMIDFQLGKRLDEEIEPFGSTLSVDSDNNADFPQDLTSVVEADMNGTQSMVVSLYREFVRYNPANIPEYFLAIFQRQQISNPRVYFVKVETEVKKFVHLKIQKSSASGRPDQVQLIGFQLNKSFDDPLDFF